LKIGYASVPHSCSICVVVLMLSPPVSRWSWSKVASSCFRYKTMAQGYEWVVSGHRTFKNLVLFRKFSSRTNKDVWY